MPWSCVVSFIIAPVFEAAQLSYRLIATLDHQQEQVNNVFRLVTFGGRPLGGLVTGILIQWIGPVWAVGSYFSLRA